MARKSGQRANPNAQHQAKAAGRRRLGWILVALLIPVTTGIIFMTTLPKRDLNQGFQFTKEGVLTFIEAESGDALKTIDIEVAADELEIERGLMWRRSMEQQQGMLFIMPKNELQSFWMLNTYIPLDLIFVNDQFQIVSIKPDRKPQALGDIQSGQPAKYVIEVNAGFCEKFGIEVDDKITYYIE